MQSTRSSMFVLVQRTACAAVILAGLSGCSAKWLDLRCQTVSHRIHMHEGTSWLLEPKVRGAPVEQKRDAWVTGAGAGSYCPSPDSVSALADVELQEKMQGPATSEVATNAVPAMGQEPAVAAAPAIAPPVAPVPPVPRMMQFETGIGVLAVHGTGDDLYADLPSNLLQAELTPVAEPVCLAMDGSRPPTGTPKNSQQAYVDYFLDKEVSLSTQKLTVIGGGISYDLHLVNEGLNCVPERKSDARRWKCAKGRSVSLDTVPGTLLDDCKRRLPSSGRRIRNLLGTIKDRYCLFVSVQERKPAGHEMISTPTNINLDQLSIDLYCVNPSGDVSPGVVIGGPRPNFRSPLPEES